MHQHHIAPEPSDMVCVGEHARPSRSQRTDGEAASLEARFLQWCFKDQHSERAQQSAQDFTAALLAVSEARAFSEHSRGRTSLFARGRLEIDRVTNRFR